MCSFVYECCWLRISLLLSLWLGISFQPFITLITAALVSFLSKCARQVNDLEWNISLWRTNLLPLFRVLAETSWFLPLRISRGCRLEPVDPSSFFNPSNSGPPITPTRDIVDTCVQPARRCEFAEAWSHMAPENGEKEEKTPPRLNVCSGLLPRHPALRRSAVYSRGCFYFCFDTFCTSSRVTRDDLCHRWLLNNIGLCGRSDIWLRGLSPPPMTSVFLHVSRSTLDVLIYIKKTLCQVSLFSDECRSVPLRLSDCVSLTLCNRFVRFCQCCIGFDGGDVISPAGGKWARQLSWL